jgi:hypothetical protein
MEMEEFKFPDEVDEKIDSGNDFDIEIEDDTPEEDRGRKPMPKEIVDEIEKDELESYSDDVKTKFKQLKKVYHDQRRTADEAQRERDAAIEATRRLLEENKKFKSMIQNGEKEYVGAMQNSANLELEMAKKAYREAYDSGDPDQILNAQEQLTKTQLKLDRVNNFKLAPLQEDNFEVQSQQNQVQQVQPDPKVMAWQKRNSWFGKNRAMTAYALGVHEDLRDSGVEVGSDMYYSKLDKTIRKTFSDYFDDEQEEAPKKAQNVVASAKRTTSSKKVTLKTSQVLLAKKLGITPEQYVKEFLKLES